MTECVQPNAPEVPCCVCRKMVKTCERIEPDGSKGYDDHRCPVHPDGTEVEGGRRVCSPECWDIECDRAEKADELCRLSETFNDERIY